MYKHSLAVYYANLHATLSVGLPDKLSNGWPKGSRMFTKLVSQPNGKLFYLSDYFLTKVVNKNSDLVFMIFKYASHKPSLKYKSPGMQQIQNL